MKTKDFLFFYANIIKFDYLDNRTNELVTDSNYKDDELHLILFVDGMLFDLQTKQRVYLLDLTDGYVNQPIYTNTGYFESLYEDTKVTESKKRLAMKFYLNYLEEQKLINEKKLLRFRVKRIY